MQRTLAVVALSSSLLLGCAGALDTDSERVAPNTLSAEELAEGFRLIFDPNDPQGWEGPWEIVNNAWIPLPQVRGALRSIEQWQNFHLKASVFISGDRNSGIYFRCDPELPLSPRNCYQVNIFDDDENFPTGSLIGSAASSVPVRTAGEWATFEVIADGAHIQVKVDGVPTVDVFDVRFTDPGNIAFQAEYTLSEPESVGRDSADLSAASGSLRVRSIRIRELD